MGGSGKGKHKNLFFAIYDVELKWMLISKPVSGVELKT